MLQGRPVVEALGRPVVEALGMRPAVGGLRTRPADRGKVKEPAADRSRPPSSLATNKATWVLKL